MKKILVLFKTHLDIGFTDFSRNVVEKYNKNYIPQSIRVARELAERGTKEGFIWTTGSWLIYQYLQQASPEQKAEFREAAANRWVSWHGLPATFHSESATKELYTYGLSLAKKLDEEFGRKTIAGKFTDVPGHTRSIVPLLHNADIEFLHIGVNPACIAPDVPNLFRWKSPDGSEITVMYNKGDYGEFTVLPGTETGIYFAHTGDNAGPSSADSIIELYQTLHERYPEADIHAADLNDVAMEIRPIVSYLPVITQEIGDTWIHGVQTDPKKINTYRGLLRLAKTCTEEEQDAIYRSLLLIPEHTWGLDEKTWLNDTENFSREHFRAVRNQPNYQKMEESWQEQRNYVTQAVENLPDSPAKEKAYQVLSEYQAEKPDFSSMQPVSGQSILLNGWSIAWNENGAICSLSKNGKAYADENHRLGLFRYEAFSEEDVTAYQDRYIKPHMRNVGWAVHDLGKVGLSADMKEYYTCDAVLKQAYINGNTLYLVLDNDAEAKELYGCPPDMYLRLTAEENSILFDFAWFDKPACRIPEALWLEFCPVKPLTAIRKLGSDVHPLEVISNGNREMHAAESPLSFEDITLDMMDSMVISVGKPYIYAFYNRLPDTTKGVWANLFNNMWGTNFPMWNEGNARFRFILK